VDVGKFGSGYFTADTVGSPDMNPKETKAKPAKNWQKFRQKARWLVSIWAC